MLNSPHTQLWELLLHYLAMTDERRLDLVEVVSFLLLLSTMELGQEYIAKNLTKDQLHMLIDMCDFGLVHVRDVRDRFSTVLPLLRKAITGYWHRNSIFPDSSRHHACVDFT